MKPSMHPDSGGSSTNDKGAKTASQVFAKEYKKCPKGQIPVRKARNSDLDTAGQLSAAQVMQGASSTKRKYVHQVRIFSRTFVIYVKFNGALQSISLFL